METKDITKEYIKHLESLKELNLKDFLSKFKLCETYKTREPYLNEFYNKEILNILQEQKFLKLFYLDSQANYIKNKLNLKDLDILKTLVYGYNTNSREFNKKVEEERLKQILTDRGFKEVEFLKYKEKETEKEFNKRKEEYYKKLDGLKVVCVMDITKIGIMGSYTEKGEYEGKLIYNGNICFLPKRNRTRGQILTSKFYYKEK